MTPLPVAGSLPDHLRQALRERGFEPQAHDAADAVVLAIGSAAVAAVRRQNKDALVVSVCEPGDWEAAVRAGAQFAIPPDPSLLRGSLEQAGAIARDRAALEAFRKAEALSVPGSKLAELEQAAILAAMRAAHGSTARAAAMLDISVRKVQYKLHEYGMPPTRKRSESEARWGRSEAPGNGMENGDGSESRSWDGGLTD
jgi:hypothetical protein